MSRQRRTACAECKACRETGHLNLSPITSRSGLEGDGRDNLVVFVIDTTLRRAACLPYAGTLVRTRRLRSLYTHPSS
jgi:hypothetical protein